MMFVSPLKLSRRIAFATAFIFCFSVFGLTLQAQTKKKSSSDKDTKTSSAKKKEDDKKTSPNKKDSAKSAQTAASKKDGSKKDTVASKSKDTDKRDKDKKDKSDNSSGKNSQKPSKAELAKQAEQKRREEEQDRREAERLDEIRRAEEARRQAILEEKRRREQAAREARARALAFERGLKTETQNNIAGDDTEGEDLEVRRAAVSALGNHAGTVVVMEAQTGKVLSIVNQEWGIRRGFKPCSTIKLVTGVAGVNEKVIDEGGNIKTRSFRMNLDDALAHSNNSYFQVVGTSIGNSRMIGYARALGLGEPTGINAEGESAGKLPYGNNNARIYSHGDDFEVTPLQLAVAVSAISNGGKVLVPQIPRNKLEKTNFRGAMRREVSIPQQNVRQVLPGMVGAVTYGTARRSGGAGLGVAGKTGSCIGQGSWLGLFASVAPVVNPRFAVVVITRGQAERGKYASAIAGNIYRALSRRYGTDDKEIIAKVPLTLKPHNKVTAQNSAKLDNSEGEDSDEGDIAKPASSSTALRPNPKKGGDDVIVIQPKSTPRVEKTVSSKPTNLFDPIVIQVNREKSRPRVVPQ